MSRLASMKLGDGGFAREVFLGDYDLFLSIDQLSGLVVTDGIKVLLPVTMHGMSGQGNYQKGIALLAQELDGRREIHRPCP